MSERNFESALRQARAQIASDTVTPEVDATLRAGIASRLARRRVRRRLAGATLGVCLVVAPALVAWRWATLPGITPLRQAGGFAVAVMAAETDIQVDTDQTVSVDRGACTLEEQTARAVLRVQSGGRVRREAGGIRVLHGTIAFDVASQVRREAPLQVFVSGGAIQVLGTLFEVRESGAEGTVALERGAVRFVPTRGTPIDLKPGESWTWSVNAPSPRATDPDPAEASVEGRSATRRKSIPPPPPPAAKPRALAEQKAEAESILRRVAALRSRNQYEQAVDELTRALRDDFPTEMRERLSFERGSILTYVLKDARRACTAWDEHVHEFSDGEYEREVTRARAAAACIDEH